MKKTTIIFLLITIFSIVFRFWNYENNINFHLDAPLFVNQMKDMVDSGKISLVGPMVTSKMVDGRGFFTGPTMFYILIPLGIISSWNVIVMTAFFGVLWVVTLILFYFWLKKKFGEEISLLLYGLISFFPWFIPHSRIIWNPAFIPLAALAVMYFLERRKQKVHYLLAGLAFGLGLSIEYIAILLLPFFIYYFVKEIRQNKFRLTNWFFVIAGAVIGEAPFLLFELKHNFYNLQTILYQIKYFRPDPTYDFNFMGHFYYYVFPFLPLYCLILGKIFQKIETKSGRNILIFSQTTIILLFIVKIILGPRDEALINPGGWDIPRQKAAVNLILEDNPVNFEVASLLGPDTRAMELRWWLRLANVKPMGVEEYTKNEVLYLVGPNTRFPEKETVWEVSSFRPFIIEKTVDLGENIYFYKLIHSSIKPTPPVLK